MSAYAVQELLFLSKKKTLLEYMKMYNNNMHLLLEEPKPTNSFHEEYL